MKISQSDYKFVPVDPEEGFSEERNRQIIQEVVEETDKISAQKRKEFSLQSEERVDAVSRFLEKVKAGMGSSDPKSYFGKKMLDYLSGREARSLSELTVYNKKGEVVRAKGDKEIRGTKA